MKKPNTIDELADAVFAEGESNSRLELVSETRTYKGGFGTYVVSNKVVEIQLDAQPSELDKHTLGDLVEELVERGGLLK